MVNKQDGRWEGGGGEGGGCVMAALITNSIRFISFYSYFVALAKVISVFGQCEDVWSLVSQI